MPAGPPPSLWSAASVSIAFHVSLVAVALLAFNQVAEIPAEAPLIVDVVLVSEAPRPGEMHEPAGTPDIADDNETANQTIASAPKMPVTTLDQPTQHVPGGATPASHPPLVPAMVLPEPIADTATMAATDDAEAPADTVKAAMTTTAVLREPVRYPIAIRPAPKPEPPRKPTAPVPATAVTRPSPHPAGTAQPHTTDPADDAGSIDRALRTMGRKAARKVAAAQSGAAQRGRRHAARFRMGSSENPKPRYPRFARLRGWQGLVILRVAVDRHGAPTAVNVDTSSTFAVLDKAAVNAVKRWRFQPARLAGVAIADDIRIPIRFRLASD